MRSSKPTAKILGALLTLPLALACQGDGGDGLGPTAEPIYFPDGSLLSPDAGGHDAGPRFSSPCTADDQCASNVCDSQFNGVCCNQACTGGDPICGAIGCDPFGECLYPAAQTSCGTHCAASALSQASCDGSGHCQASGPATPCPSGFGCALGDTACAPLCREQAQCAEGFYCSDLGTCAPTQDAGFCGSDSQCTSGACGIAGLGACCAVSCRSADPECGATGCDPISAACQYPGSEVGCGKASCSEGQLTRGVCDSEGDCGPATTGPCPGHFACAADGINCLTSCESNADCGPAESCDAPYNQCCPALPPHSTVFVADVVRVSPTNSNPYYIQNFDSPCCGSDSAHPCATITRAMQRVAQSTAVGATLSVSGGLPSAFSTNFVLPASGCEWNSDSETWPVHLGWGVTLFAPGIAFHMGAPQWQAIRAATTPGGSPTTVPMFDVRPYDAGDVFPVTLSGGLTPYCSGPMALGESYVTVGQSGQATLLRPDSEGNCSAGDGGLACGQGFNVLVLDEGLPLRLDQVQLAYAHWGYNFASQTDVSFGLVALPGSAVTLGPGPVVVGEPELHPVGFSLNALDNSSGPEYGIVLNPDSSVQFYLGLTGPIGSGAVSLSDDTGGLNVLTTAQIEGGALEILGPATVKLVNGPVLGQTPISVTDISGNNILRCPWSIQQDQPDPIPLLTPDGTGITVTSDLVNLTFGSLAQPGAIQCMSAGNDYAQLGYASDGNGVEAMAGPQTTIDLINTTLSGNACAGIYASGGSVNVSGNSTIVGNQVGVWLANEAPNLEGMTNPPASISLDDARAPTTVACNFGNATALTSPNPACLSSVLRRGQYLNYGANLANLSPTAVLDARNVILGDSEANVCDSIDATQPPGNVEVLTRLSNSDGIDPATCQCTGPLCRGGAQLDSLGAVSVSVNDPLYPRTNPAAPFRLDGVTTYTGTCQ